MYLTQYLLIFDKPMYAEDTAIYLLLIIYAHEFQVFTYYSLEKSYI